MAVAEAQAQALDLIGKAADTQAGQKAVQLELATKAIHAKEMIARKSSLVVLPDGASDAGAMVSQAMSIIQKLSSNSEQASADKSAMPAAKEQTGLMSEPGPWGA